MKKTPVHSRMPVNQDTITASQGRTRKSMRSARRFRAQSSWSKSLPVGKEKAKTGAEKRTGRSRSNNARSQQKAQPAENQPAQKKAQHQMQQNQKNTRPRTQGRRKKDGKKPLVRIIPLGSLMKSGKNMTVYECGNDMFIVDCGLALPGRNDAGHRHRHSRTLPMLVQNKEKIRGVFITHGHEDHIGGIPYLMKEIDAPLYATKLTLGLYQK